MESLIKVILPVLFFVSIPYFFSLLKPAENEAKRLIREKMDKKRANIEKISARIRHEFDERIKKEKEEEAAAKAAEAIVSPTTARDQKRKEQELKVS